MDKQLVIPGMLPPAPPKPKPANMQQRVGQLEERTIRLEIDLTILKAQLEGDKDNA